MTAPVISVLPDAPQRGVDSQEVFTSKANALVDSLETLVSETNAMGTWMNTTASEVESDRIASAANASTATQKANEAAGSAANAALSLGDYQGDYSASTSYTAGQSVSYDGRIYIAKQGTTGNLPTNTTYWFKGTGSAAIADIVGTVSQSGGVLTGSIIERGGNANGNYVKFADGTMICWGQYIGGSESMESLILINGFYTFSVSVNFPVEFSSIPVVTSSGGNNTNGQGFGGKDSTLSTTTIGKFRYWTNAESFSGTVLTWNAIGSWY